MVNIGAYHVDDGTTPLRGMLKIMNLYIQYTIKTLSKYYKNENIMIFSWVISETSILCT